MIRKLADLGYVPRVGRGQYPVAGAIQGYIRYLTEQRATAIAARAPGNELAEVKAREIQLRLKRREAEVMETDGVETFFADVRTILADEFAGIFRDLPLADRISADLGIAGVLSRYDRRAARAISDLRAGRDPVSDPLDDD